MMEEYSDLQGDKGVEARYANYFEIGQNTAEFILDFGQVYSMAEERHIHTRIVTSPAYAKVFLRLLENSIRHHEEVCGKIAKC